MTDFIHGEALLEEAEINRIIESAPSDLVAFQERAAQQPVEAREPRSTWLERFHEQEIHHA